MNKLNNLTGSGANGGNRSGTKGNAGGQHNDMGDRAFDAAAKKSGHNIPSSAAEKITDTARGMFEKTTGKKVDPKYSN
ncbi:hypothetical protein VTI28DRAFT_2286 [Corynascus sepedonium]